MRLPTDEEPVVVVEGDALDVLRALPVESIDAVVSDPPYGINTKSDGNGKLNPWADLCNAAYWYTAWIGECRRVLKPTGSMWCCFNWRGLPTLQKASCDLRWPIESLMIWDKCWIGPGGEKGLRPSYEVVALFAMPEFAITNRGLPDVQRFQWSAHKPHGHPAEKPLDLMRFCVKHGSPVGGVVLDPFGGSGTTADACVREDRLCLTVETDAMFAAVARRRVADAMGGALLAPVPS